ncbi:endonuclease [Roseivivax sp. CAU 1753]
MAGGIGLVFFVLLLTIGDASGFLAIVLTAIVIVGLGMYFNRKYCSGSPRSAGAMTARSSSAPGTPAKTPAATKPETKPETKPATDTATASPATAPAEPTPASPAVTGAPAPASASATADAEAGAKVKPSKSLAGQAELATRKGSWTYQASPDPQAATAPDTAADTDAATAASMAPGAPQDKPATLDAARDGKADDLKVIKGVGPKLEIMLNDMGFYHYDQIARWSDSEINWVNNNLTGFKGRVTRDDWVEQAKILAAGGETEFSRRADKGDVS